MSDHFWQIVKLVKLTLWLNNNIEFQHCSTFIFPFFLSLSFLDFFYCWWKYVKYINFLKVMVLKIEGEVCMKCWRSYIRSEFQRIYSDESLWWDALLLLSDVCGGEVANSGSHTHTHTHVLLSLEFSARLWFCWWWLWGIWHRRQFVLVGWMWTREYANYHNASVRAKSEGHI